MNPRNRILVLALGGVTLFALLAAGYFFVADPYLKRAKVVGGLEGEADEKEAQLAGLRATTKHLKELQKQSLPADPEVAKREYDLALMKLLKDSGARNYTVNYVDGESNVKTGIPQIDPNFRPSRDSKPADYLAYTPVVYRMVIPKTDLQTVAEVLRRYYSLGLLHQITRLEIRHTGSADLGKDERPAKERTDLNVEITTRAIIVNGAPSRRTLMPAPAPYGGVFGGAGMAWLEQTPSAARNVNPIPEPFGPILARAENGTAPLREYQYVAARDIYHGPLPEIKPEPVKPPPTKIEEPPPPPKPDYREFIWYTTAIHTAEGDDHTLEITIKDKINKEDYALVITQAGEKMRVKVTKYYYDNFKINPAERKKKEYMNQETLEISKPSTMSNKNNFTVYGVDTDGSLILGERPTGLTPELPKDDRTPARPGGGFGGGGFGGGRQPSRTALPPADPKAALIGGLVVTAPKAEKFYRWESGKNLKQIVELSKSEADAAIRRAQTRFLSTTSIKPDGPR